MVVKDKLPVTRRPATVTIVAADRRHEQKLKNTWTCGSSSMPTRP